MHELEEGESMQEEVEDHGKRRRASMVGMQRGRKQKVKWKRLETSICETRHKGGKMERGWPALLMLKRAV